MQVTPEVIVRQARTWLGTPFHHQGRLKGVGCDCLGMIIGVAEELQLTHDGVRLSSLDHTSYSHTPNTAALLAANGHKLIREQEVTTASVHDSEGFEGIAVLKEGGEIFADSAYRSEKTEALLAKCKVVSQIQERAYRNIPLTKAQKRSNKGMAVVNTRV